MDAFSDPLVETVVLMLASQVGKTEALNNLVGYHVDVDPCPILNIQPTLEMAQTWSKDRLVPMLRDTPSLHGKVKDPWTRDANNTTLHKVFAGGHLTVVGANSAAGLASRPIRVVLADEVDRYEPSATGEGDPIELATKRTQTFWNRKIGLASSPKIKGESRIEAAYDASDRRKYFVPCPFCRHEQTLRWANVKWPSGQPELAGYECEACHKVWNDHERIAAVALGKWRPGAPFRGVAGFHVNALVSPWVELGKLAKVFVEVKDFPDRLQVFTNTALAETWEDQAGERVEETGLLARRERYGPKAPTGVVVVVVGVDVQDDRVEVEFLGIGRGEETWSLRYVVIRADPSTNTPWRELDELLAAPIERDDGVKLFVKAAAVDTGGHHTQAAYAFCRERYARRIWAVKGQSGGGKLIWPRRPSRKNIGKVNLFLVGVDAAKDLLFARLKITEPGPGFCHFPDDRDEEYFAQLTAEKIVTQYWKGRPKRSWVKTRPRNEALDVRVYALAAFAGVLSAGFNLDKEAAGLDELAAKLSAGAVRTAPTTVGGALAYHPRRVRSPGVVL